LLSARQKILDKDGFTDYSFAVWALPSVTLGNAPVSNSVFSKCVADELFLQHGLHVVHVGLVLQLH
jgi:hypothetical protein